MKRSRIRTFNPLISVEENAANNNVSVAAIRYYIKTNGIDLSGDKQMARYRQILDYSRRHPQEKAPEIAKALGLSASTVRKYLAMKEPPKIAGKKLSALRKAESVHFMSVSENQSDILKSILSIHLPRRSRFDCDLTAWKCGFYKDGLLRPIWLYDKYPQLPEVKNLDTIDQDSLYGALKSVVVDLPTTVVMPSTKRITLGTFFSSMEDLYQEHKKMLKLSFRLLRSDGILIYKTMDFSFGCETEWISDYVLWEAVHQGFVLLDKYILIDRNNAKIDRRRTKYTVSAPAHAYFFVFKKRQQEEDQRDNGIW